MNNNTILSNNLRRILKERHIQQQEFSDMIGTSRQQINGYVNGKCYPSPSTVIKICDVLNISQYDLTATESDYDILKYGHMVMDNKSLRKIADMVEDETINNEQLEKITDMITSLK